jgi:hypothetical protein
MVNSFSCFFLFGFSYFHSFEHYAINNKSKIQGNKIHNKIFHNIVRSFVTNYSSGISTKVYRSHSLWIFLHGEILIFFCLSKVSHFMFPCSSCIFSLFYKIEGINKITLGLNDSLLIKVNPLRYVSPFIMM